jgi:hypothetical protein
MATLQSINDFREAISYLQSVDHVGSAVLQVNVGDTVAECEVLDDETRTDITPDMATLESALDSANAEIATQQTIETLQNLTRSDAIVYFRNGLASAAGNGAAIATLYTQARAYEQQNQMLTDTMLTLRTIEETAIGLTLVLTTNQDKAKYLKLFLTALGLWS